MIEMGYLTQPIKLVEWATLDNETKKLCLVGRQFLPSPLDIEVFAAYVLTTAFWPKTDPVNAQNAAIRGGKSGVLAFEKAQAYRNAVSTVLMDKAGFIDVAGSMVYRFHVLKFSHHQKHLMSRSFQKVETLDQDDFEGVNGAALSALWDAYKSGVVGVPAYRDLFSAFAVAPVADSGSKRSSGKVTLDSFLAAAKLISDDDL